MKDFPFIWLLFYTKTGKVILGLLIGYIIVRIVGWWMIPIIAAFIGAVLLYDYFFTQPRLNKKHRNSNKIELVIGICFFVFALIFVVGMISYNNRTYEHNYYPSQYEPTNTKKEIEDDTYVPDSVEIIETDKPKPTKSSSSSRKTYREPDNMRGFDPASEDDMEDNGMSRYMEANDDEGWD